jgi:hypothetical protein
MSSTKPTKPSSDKPTTRKAVLPVMVLPDGSSVVARSGTKGSVQHRALDLCFVFDTTGSMSDKIDGLVECMDGLVAKLGNLALDWRVTTVPFGDLTVPGDRVIIDEPFVASVSAATQQLRSMPRFSGGGNTGESAVEAMLAACRKTYRKDAVKVLVLITDEPALGYKQGQHSVHSSLSSLDAICFTVAPDFSYYKQWASQHGGEWRQVNVSVSTTAIMNLFTSLLTRMVEVVDSVHRLGGGSVRAYLGQGRAS